MNLQSVNPATGDPIETYPQWSDERIQKAVAASVAAQRRWRDVPLAQRCEAIERIAYGLERNRDALAGVITAEMGKLTGEAVSEVEKCAWLCRYYAEQAPEFLADEKIESDASRSAIVRQPLGVVLAIMPWNFPFWQVFRCAIPALAAGNAVLLKHASNVCGCALEIEELATRAGLPTGLFQACLIDTRQVRSLIGDARISAVSLTGSEKAGRSVAETAGKHLKKTVLELGGSDAFVVLPDADLEAAVEAAIASRFLNCGQSCIAAKRFLVAKACHDEFTERFVSAVRELRPGDPRDADTRLAPMARGDLRDGLHTQVQATVARGGRLLTGGEPADSAGFFYPATVVDRVPEDSPMFHEEVFGPAAAILSFADEDAAIAMANASDYGLGGSVWSQDAERAEHVARRLECGSAFVNGMVRSDPRLPFGGIKQSGFGRELSALGIQEFTNAKTVWIA